MAILKIFDKTLTKLTEIETYKSFIFTRRLRKYGEFKIEININLPNTEYLQKGNFVLLDDRTNIFGIIKHREIKLDEQGQISEVLMITGYTLDYVFNQRVIKGTDNITGDAETVMKHYIDVCVTNPVDTNRKIDLFTLTTNQNRGVSLTWEERYTQLDKVQTDISYASDIGVVCDYNETEILIDIYEITDKTEGSLTPVIFAVEFDNIKSQSLIDSDIGYKNYAYAAGTGSDPTRIISETGTTETGLDRYETFFSFNVSTSVELDNLSEQKLLTFPKTFALDSQILKRAPFIYLVDWDIGDKVTVKNTKWGVETDRIITEVQEVYENGQFNIFVTFGDSPTDIINQINSRFINPDNDVRR